MAIDELADQPSGRRRSAVDRHDPRAADLGLGELPARDRPLGQDDRAGGSRPGRSRRQPTPTCCPVDAQTAAVAPSSSAFETRHRHPAVLERPGRIRPLVLEVHLDADAAPRSAGAGRSGVEPSSSETTGVVGDREAVAVALDQAGHTIPLDRSRHEHRFGSSSEPGSRIAITRSPGRSSVSPTAISAWPPRLTEIRRDFAGRLRSRTSRPAAGESCVDRELDDLEVLAPQVEQRDELVVRQLVLDQGQDRGRRRDGRARCRPCRSAAGFAGR